MKSRFLVLMLWIASRMACASEELQVPIDYQEQVKPLIAEHCVVCHGARAQKGGLRLDTARFAIQGGDSGQAVVPGDSETSLLIQRVTASDESEQMPQEGRHLSPTEIQILRNWIDQNAPAPANEVPEQAPGEHWAFQPLRRPPIPAAMPPSLAPGGFIQTPVDAFVARQHAVHGLVPQAEASRLTLIRRVHLDLIGVPPTPEETRIWESTDDPDWYERLVEQLLADPRHGERWARHWMDIWRYSDWWGLGDQLRNSQPHLWHWRDWIVESLNADLGYDEMIRLMLAADELYPNDPDRLRATGFLARNYFLFNRNQWLDETVEHVSKGLLGLTINCAKCHDHKFDPIAQVDYYRMRAFFEPYHVRLDLVPGEPDLAMDGIPRVFDGVLDAPTYRFERGQENDPDKSAVIAPGVPAIFTFAELAVVPVELPIEAWQPARRPGVLETYLEASRRSVVAAESALQSARENLWRLRALRPSSEISPAGLPPVVADPLGDDGEAAKDVSQAAIPAPAGDSIEVTEAESVCRLAEADVEVATADHRSTDCRAKAMRAGWARTDAGGGDATLLECERRTTMDAIRAERELSLAQAKRGVLRVEQRLSKATAAEREAIEKELTAAREVLNKANDKSCAEVLPTDMYVPLIGAKWTPTRFYSSQADDPPVAFPPQSSGRRTSLARWITDVRNPLTARVAVNHIWARHMGSPLVPTVFDFGRKGATSSQSSTGVPPVSQQNTQSSTGVPPVSQQNSSTGVPPVSSSDLQQQPFVPAHRELLDWLAVELIESGWSMKHLHRLIMCSSTYRLASFADGSNTNLANDPENVYWWRKVPSRLESQVIRDSILALAGRLDQRQGGPPVLPADQGGSTRRSLYFFHSNNERERFLTTFDEASVKECYRRDESIVPQQALALMNSSLAHDACPQIVDRLMAYLRGSCQAQDDTTFVRAAFVAVLGVRASDAELEACLSGMRDWRALPEISQAADIELAARRYLIWTLLNHNDFVTLR